MQPEPTLWPRNSTELEALQRTLAERSEREPAWHHQEDRPPAVGAVFAATPRGVVGAGAAGQRASAAAVVFLGGRMVDSVVLVDRFDAPYAPALLALREGRLLELVVRCLEHTPDVLIVNATGRDHPRRAGLAVHLGVACGLPTIGVTDRPLIAVGAEPGPEAAATAGLWLEHELVGYVLRTRAGARAVVVHAGWRVDAETARAVVLSVNGRARTPEPLRQARRLARTSRSATGETRS